MGWDPNSGPVLLTPLPPPSRAAGSDYPPKRLIALYTTAAAKSARASEGILEDRRASCRGQRAQKNVRRGIMRGIHLPVQRGIAAGFSELDDMQGWTDLDNLQEKEALGCSTRRKLNKSTALAQPYLCICREATRARWPLGRKPDLQLNHTKKAGAGLQLNHRDGLPYQGGNFYSSFFFFF